MEQILVLIGFGIISGAVFAVPAIGMTLMYGVSRFLNFAYGQWMTLGAYFAWTLSQYLPLYFALPVAILAVSIYGVVIYRIIFRPFERRSEMVLLIASLGLAFFMQNLITAIWGVDIKRLSVPSYLNKGISLGPFHATPLLLIVLLIALAIMAIVVLIMFRTDLGIKIRATAENQDLARVSAIHTDRIILVTWILASALAALGGIMAAMMGSFTPRLGSTLLLTVASAMILGGLGNPSGAVVGALILGITMELSTLIINPALKSGVAFATLALVLLIRPAGIFGRDIY